MRHLDTSAVQTLQFAKICFPVTLFPHGNVQSLPTAEWLELHGIIISRYLRFFSKYRGTVINRNLGDAGIATIAITIPQFCCLWSCSTELSTSSRSRLIFIIILFLQPSQN